MLVERLIQKLQKSGTPAASSSPEVEKLTGDVAKLVARIDDLEAKLAAKVEKSV